MTLDIGYGPGNWTIATISQGYGNQVFFSVSFDLYLLLVYPNVALSTCRDALAKAAKTRVPCPKCPVMHRYICE